ncbi:retinol dehydrogenase 16-like isoform X2 [Erinaceus europaeus]|uniref:Retinol dehydrogenase 16-like isoform X2 n=1 Tax=Erinaceus europaeus TaxID=9365 RepID=A0A1S3WR65_ERIEU|nr:retinol dehydrogenase 16-like isoform X2 [Erinaceus europaeus]
MWLLCMVALVGLYHLVRWHRERQVVSQLRDKYVFITGCDSGFGNLLARQLDLRGLRVLAACLTEKGAEQLRDQTSDRLETVILDVTKSESIAEATQWVKELVGDRGLWGLVNNAGVSMPTAPNEWLARQDFMKIIDVNLLGVIEVTLSLLPLLRKAKGRVVNVSSVLGRIAIFGGGYSISKYGVEAFSDTLRREISTFGVKVTMIEPGYFKTPLTSSENLSENFRKAWEKARPEVKDVYGEKFLNSCSSGTFHGILEVLRTMKQISVLKKRDPPHTYPDLEHTKGFDFKTLPP